jgi:hypothetical protein
LGFALAAPAAAVAQSPQGTPAPKLPDRTYMTKNAFYLPVIIDDRVRTGLQEIRLYVKEGPGGVWECKEKLGPAATGFNYRLTADGEYWFSVVTIDQAGRTVPADVNREPPGVIIVLDTQGPQVDMHTLPPSPEGICVQCDVLDANPNPFQTRLEYQTGDHVWRAAEALPNQPECFLIPKQAVLTGMVKVSCCDRALNTTVREFNLATVTAAATAASAQVANNQAPASPVVQPIKFEDRDPPQVTKSSYMSLPVPASDMGTEAVKLATAPPPVREPRDLRIHTTDVTTQPEETPASTGPRLPDQSSRKVETPEPPHAVPQMLQDVPRKLEAQNGNRYLVNNPCVTLEYKVEDDAKGGVGKVEVWYTQDGGKTWDVLCDDPDRKSPVQFKLPAEGVYGIRLAVSNARGFGAEPPKAGDAPELVIELDTTKPVAKLESVKLVPASEDSASIDIVWSAFDKNLGAEPIALYYSVNAGGPWTPIAKGLRNEGKYRWYLPQGMGKQAFVRLVATDQAGNTCRCELGEPIALDDGKRPSVTITGVVPASATMPGGN